jgi:hypothetical protein
VYIIRTRDGITGKEGKREGHSPSPIYSPIMVEVYVVV